MPLFLGEENAELADYHSIMVGCHIRYDLVSRNSEGQQISTDGPHSAEESMVWNSKNCWSVAGKFA